MSLCTFSWDGSFLGIFDTAPWWHTCRYLDRTYGFLMLQDGWQVVHIVRSNNILPVLIDEIKPYFNLLKRGSHRLQIKRVHYIIYYVPCIPTRDKVIYELPLSQVPLDTIKTFIQNELFTAFMRAIIIFCHVLHIPLSNTKIWLRIVQHEDDYIIVPLLTTETKINSTSTTIPITMRKRWCDKLSMSYLMSYIVEDDSLVNRMTLLQQVQSIIHSIDITYLYVYNFMSAALYTM